MEEKIIKTRGSFRSISYHRSLNKFLFLRTSSPKNTKSSLLNSLGFTFIEVIIVIAVIGILSAGLITILDPAGQLRGSRDSKRKSDLKQIQSSLELYRADVGVYPDASDIGNDVANYNSNSSFVDDPGDVQITYLQAVPKDPKTNAHYYFCTDASCGVTTNGYRLYACLEKTSDPEKASGATPAYLNCPAGSAYIFVTNP